MNRQPSPSSSYSFSSLVLECRSDRGQERWTKAILFVFLVFLGVTPLCADPGAKLIIPKPEAWTGQRVPLFIELRAEGSFKGAASFDLPEIPKTVIIKIGSPTLSSETTGDAEVFVQRHEFALFSQADGTLELPPITARFSHTKGYTGPTFDTTSETEAATLILKRPPNSELLGFIVTSGSLEIEESWDPTPGPLETGAILKRTIVQRASGLTGIALKSAPTPEIEGIRTYAANPEVTDKTERGEFLGERRETITYLVQQAGLHSLPEFRYDWWNPSTETLETLTLSAVTFTAVAAPQPPQKPSPLRFLRIIIPALLVVLAILCRRQIIAGIHRLHQCLDPPLNRARRHFLSACHQNKAVVARRTWNELRTFHPNAKLSDELKQELNKLWVLEFGRPSSSEVWSGQTLAEAYKQDFAASSKARTDSALPSLNP